MYAEEIYNTTKVCLANEDFYTDTVGLGETTFTVDSSGVTGLSDISKKEFQKEFTSEYKDPKFDKLGAETYIVTIDYYGSVKVEVGRDINSPLSELQPNLDPSYR